jgi:hypothetical protein
MMSEVCHAPVIGTVMGVTSVIWTVMDITRRGNPVRRHPLGGIESSEMTAPSLPPAWLGGNG